MTRIWPIPGGIHPPERKQQSLQLPLAEMPVPAELIYPLNQHIGAPAVPVVEVGDRVLGGQMIAAPHGIFSAPIHAASSGTVTALEERPLPHPSGLAGDCIVIETDGKDEQIDFEPCENWNDLDHDELVARVRNAGITGMGGASFPTAVKLNPRSNQKIDTLILNGTECEPYITADDILMQARAADVVNGARLFAHILRQPQRVVIGIEDNKPEALQAIREAAEGSDVEVVSFPTKYPSGGEKQLIQILTGREVPSGKLPADVGVIVQNVGTAVAAWEAVRFGKPLLSRITTVVGEALETQRNVLVRLGTPIEHILRENGYRPEQAARLILGGPMMGFALETSQVPVVKSSNCILVPAHDELAPPQPAQSCIRCGLCAEACPASLLPQQLYWYAQAEDYERLQAHNLRDCIECGACSYVCPSNIPLVQYYRSAKGTLRQMELDRQKSDRSRARFEFRQERLQRAEAEKEAKRAARKKAAEAARSKLDASPQTAPGKSVNAGSDPVSAAIASAGATNPNPQQEQQRLQRSLESARARLDKLRGKLADAEESQRDRLGAQIKQTELKVVELEKKLQSSAVTEAPATKPEGQESDPVAVAIARAKAKNAMSPAEKLQSNIASLEQRLAKAEEKLAVAKAEGADTVSALEMGAEKLREKLQINKRDLAELQRDTEPPKPVDAAASDAAAAAIERARARAAAQADMTADEKLRQQIESLEARLEKAHTRLARAEAEQDANLDAFRSGVEKTRARLQQAKSELESMQ